MSTDSEREIERLFDERARRMVQNEIMGCESSLISILASGYGVVERGELADLCEQAFDLATPIPDYESATEEIGWTGPHKDEFGATFFRDDSDGQTYCAADWKELCDAFNIDPQDREVFEHWQVSGWMADQLEAFGEKVDKDFAGKCIWARTTTGQAIYGDYVIRQIVKSLYSADEIKPE